MSNDVQNGATPNRKQRIGPPRSLAELIQRHLTRSRTTAAALARKADVQKSLLSKVLAGKQRTMDHSNIMKLAKAMDIGWERFYLAERLHKEDRKLKPVTNTFRQSS